MAMPAEPTDEELNEFVRDLLLDEAAKGERDADGELTPAAAEHVRAVADACRDREYLADLWAEAHAAGAGTGEAAEAAAAARA